MADKHYRDMTDDELVGAYDLWNEHCRSAPGWSSAYFSAKQVKHICAEASRRGLPLKNNFEIVKGAS